MTNENGLFKLISMSFAEVSATSQQSYKCNGKELNTEREDVFYNYSTRYIDSALGIYIMYP